MTDKHKYIVPIVIGILYAIGIWCLLTDTQCFELIYEYTREHEELGLDEVILTIPLLLLSISWFAIHQLKNVRKVLKEKNTLNDELVQANERIERLSQEREQFIAIAYHELVNSLSGVANTLQLLELSESKEEIGQNIVQARILSDGLRQYSSDILYVTRQIMGEADDEPMEFNLRQTIGEAVRTARLRADQKGLDIILDYDLTLPQIHRGSPKLIRHIVQNLTQNSVKHTEEGVIRVYCSYSASSKNALVIQVSDTGQGVPPQLQEAIFDPYKQLSKGEKTTEGIGLGLFIVKRLVDALNGTISVEENKPQGSIFKVTIPFVNPN